MEVRFIKPEEAENFEIKNIVFKNISYTSYMESKIDGNKNRSNTVQVELDGITVEGKLQKYQKTKFKIGRYCDVTVK